MLQSTKEPRQIDIISPQLFAHNSLHSIFNAHFDIYLSKNYQNRDIIYIFVFSLERNCFFLPNSQTTLTYAQ